MDQISPLPTVPPINDKGVVQPEPERIIERGMKKVGNHVVTEVLVKWVGADMEDNSWELLYNLRSLYPHLVGNVL